MVNRDSHRTELERLLKLLQKAEHATEGRMSGLAYVLSGAAADEDTASLERAHEGLEELVEIWESRDDAGTEVRAQQRGVLIGFIEIVGWALERCVQQLDAEALDRDLRPLMLAFLLHVSQNPACGNKQVQEALASGPSEISRIGSDLVRLGLARRRRVGRENEWALTEAGRQFVGDRLDDDPPSVQNKRIVLAAFESVLRTGPRDASWAPPSGLAALDERLEKLRRRGIVRARIQDPERDLMAEGEFVQCRVRLEAYFHGGTRSEQWHEVWRARVADGQLIDAALVSQPYDPLPELDRDSALQPRMGPVAVGTIPKPSGLEIRTAGTYLTHKDLENEPAELQIAMPAGNGFTIEADPARAVRNAAATEATDLLMSAGR
jgi:hypothetical protein